jgi:hypothetical protein
MTHDRALIRKHAGLIIVAFLTMATYVIQYFARQLDNNRLTSWQWCFNDSVAVKVFVAIASGTLLAYLLALSEVRLRRRGALLFFLAFSATCLYWQEPEVIMDASRYFTQAKHLELYGFRYFLREWGGDIVAWTDMPLVPFLYGVIFRFFGESRLYLQVFTGVLFALTVVLTYRVGCELWDDDIGFYGGVFLLGIPYLYSQTPLMLVDVASTFFFFLAVFLFIRAMKRGGIWIPLAGAAIFLAFYSKYSVWLMLSVFAVIVAVFAILGSSEKDRLREMLSRTALVVFFSAFLVGALFLYKFDVIVEQVRLLISYQKPGLHRWGESFVSTFLFQVHPFITVLGIFSAWIAIRKRDPKYIIVVWLAMLFVLLQIKRSRYSIVIFPMVTLAASYGLCQFDDKRIRRCVAACVVTSSLAVALFSYLPFLQRLSAVNIQQAGAFLNGMKGSDVEVFSLTSRDPVVDPAVSVPLLDIFTRKHIIYHYRSELSPRMRERIAASSLRFTLEYNNPQYYVEPSAGGGYPSVAVISETGKDALPIDLQTRLAGYRMVKDYDAGEGIFRYRTSVRIYERMSP